MKLAFCLAFSLAAVSAAWAADCDSLKISQRESDKQLVLTNSSDKAIVAYVLRSISVDANDSAIRTLSGVFSGKDSLAPSKSLDLGPADAGSSQMVVDFARFADGSTCGPANTPRGKELASAIYIK